jgi:cyclophilin family peptidyl-prolyl cis-trans isomerase
LADFGSRFSGLEGDSDVEVVGSDADVEVVGGGGGGFFSFLRPKEPSLDDNYNRNRCSDKEDEFEYEYGEGRVTMDVTLPMLESYQEGFYDPLTAKPRRLPIKIVAMDGNKAKLTYSSRFSPLEGNVVSDEKKKQPSSSTVATSSPGSLKPVLSFDVPGLVAMNHPDRVSNGASSKFFSIPKRDISKKRTRLLDGQFDPFGYITDGLELYQSLRPGGVIGATYVSEWGR